MIGTFDNKKLRIVLFTSFCALCCNTHSHSKITERVIAEQHKGCEEIYKGKEKDYSNCMIIMTDMPIIKAFSMMVILLMGRLKTVPKQAHCIFRFSNTDCKTPIILILITNKVITLVSKGAIPIRKATPNNNSIKA